jgi:hypothetical protein
MADRRGNAGASEPTTVRPPFDPEVFARESDSKVHDALPPSARPTVPPANPAGTHAASPTDVPTLAVAREDLEWFDLSPSARELLLHINGRDAVDALAERARSPVTEVLRELARLADEGLVTWR